MADVVNLRGGAISTKAGVPRAELIEGLEAALALAKSGKLQSFVGTGFTSDHQRLTMWADYHENIIEFYGAIKWLGAEYVNRTTAAVEADEIDG